MGSPVEIAIAVVEHAGQWLIGLRPQGGPLAGYWEFPGGKVELGEGPEAAAERECYEETGLAVRVVGEFPLAEYEYDHASVRLHFFRCQVICVTSECLEPRGALPVVTSRFRWVNASKLSDYQFPPANQALIARLQAV